MSYLNQAIFLALSLFGAPTYAALETVPQRGRDILKKRSAIDATTSLIAQETKMVWPQLTEKFIALTVIRGFYPPAQTPRHSPGRGKRFLIGIAT